MKLRPSPIRWAFTLIELLIVVAIIAILAAIAVPNFLEAQVRSKVSRAKSDMRSIATALESYAVDANHYPPDSNYWIVTRGLPGYVGMAASLCRLTSPIAYMTSIPRNPFLNNTDDRDRPPQYRYYGTEWLAFMRAFSSIAVLRTTDPQFKWSLVSTGPDGISNVGEYYMYGPGVFYSLLPSIALPPYWGPPAVYDPTNGTVSTGDIIDVGPGNTMI